MATGTSHFNIVVDPLYGAYSLDPLVRDLMVQPEIQRLREVRLSNINSILMPGIANISRFEHCLGTAHLASRLAARAGLGKQDQFTLVCAALYHDVGIAPFGHLMEEGFQYAGLKFDHEKRLREIFQSAAEIGNVHAQIFRGKTAGIHSVLNRKDVRAQHVSLESIFATIDGTAPLGPLINGSIDLDNIDNVCRMAWHMGLEFPRDLPVRLVDGFVLEGHSIGYDASKLHVISEWLRLRERLYELLMTNPSDFVAKAMLIEAVRIGLKGAPGNSPILDDADWKLTDFELVTKLLEHPPTSMLLDRLLRGHLYELAGLYWVKANSWPANFVLDGIGELRQRIAHRMGTGPSQVLLYVIRDKRTREIKNLRLVNSDTSQSQSVTLGTASSVRLLGVATSISKIGISKQAELVREVIAEHFGAENVSPCDSEAHQKRAFEHERLF